MPSQCPTSSIVSLAFACLINLPRAAVKFSEMLPDSVPAIVVPRSTRSLLFGVQDK